MPAKDQSMPVTLLCPNLKCRRVLQVPDTVRGKQVRCSHCGSHLLVPPGKPAAPAKAGAKAADGKS